MDREQNAAFLRRAADFFHVCGILRHPLYPLQFHGAYAQFLCTSQARERTAVARCGKRGACDGKSECSGTCDHT